MQLFPCPFCGLRPETEFHYSGEAGNLRPDGPDVSPERWAEYLYMRSNPKGEAVEIWMHRICAETFEMVRDTLTNSVRGSRTIGEGIDAP
jgi:sarcosine oxidase subunit delta